MTPDGRIVAVAVQLIEVPQGVIVKRGVDELLVSGEHAREVVTRVLAEAGASLDGLRPEEICARLQGGDALAGADFRGVVEQLRARNMLVDVADRPPYPERPDQILTWNLGTNPSTALDALRGVSIEVLGVNGISRRLVESLVAVGGRVRVVDHPALRNVRLFGIDGILEPAGWGSVEPEPFDAWETSLQADSQTCLIACSDFGGFHLLAEWNALAQRNRWDFLPIVLQNLVGNVGPLVIPGETACFQCLLAREEANLLDPASTRATERFAFGGQTVAAYHPSMASMLGDLAALELTKHYGYAWPSAATGKLIELNFMAATTQLRPVLKVPGCPVCSPLNRFGAIDLMTRPQGAGIGG